MGFSVKNAIKISRSGCCYAASLPISRELLATALCRLQSSNSGAALAKADRRVTSPSAVGAEDHLVAVIEKRPACPGGERYLSLAVGAQLHQAAIALRRRP